MSNELWWYLARAGGIVAWALLSASVLWGLALSTKILGSRPRANWMLDLHRYLGGLAVAFTGLHVLGLVADSYMSFGPVQLLVPFTSSYRPSAVAWGVIGVYLLAAVEITSLLRNRLSRRAWRTTHALSFPLFGLATLHGLRAGTDATGAPLFYSMLAVSVAVFGLTAASIDQHLRSRRRSSTRSGRAAAGGAARESISSPTPTPQETPRGTDQSRPAWFAVGAAHRGLGDPVIDRRPTA
jgi:predicted ferric reductase